MLWPLPSALYQVYCLIEGWEYRLFLRILEHLWSVNVVTLEKSNEILECSSVRYVVDEDDCLSSIIVLSAD